MTTKGVYPGAADAISWLVTFALLLGLLYVAPVAVFLVLLALAAIAVVRNADDRHDQDWFPRPTDHRDEPFYHPLSYNDDADPRFEDK